MKKLLKLIQDRNRRQEYITLKSQRKYSVPLVSVSVLAYRHANYIRDCLESILKQSTTFPYEIIVGEDDSPDATRAICIEYANRYPDRIRLFLRSREDVMHINSYPTGRFNSLANLKAAKGRFFALCEGDDYWTDPQKLQKQVEFMETYLDCTMCFHPARILSMDGKIRGSHVRPHKGNKFFSIEDIILGGGGFFPTASFMCVRECLFPLPKYFLQSSVGDTCFALACASKGRVGYIDETMSVYRAGAPFSWNMQAAQNRMMQVRHLCSHIDTLNQFLDEMKGLYVDLVRKKSFDLIQTLAKTIILGLIDRSSQNIIGNKADKMKRIAQNIIKKKLFGKRLIIFGSGESAVDAISLLSFSNLDHLIDCILDNDRKKWGKNLYGHKIMNPAKAFNNSSHGFFILIASTYYDEISEQLLEIGLFEGLSFYRDLRMYADIFKACYPDFTDIVSKPHERIDLDQLIKKIAKNVSIKA